MAFAACGGSDEAADTSSDADAADVATDAPTTDDSSTDAQVGDATLRVGDDEFENLEGDCDIARGSGTDDVGNVSEEGKTVIVAIDNTHLESGNDTNFIMTNERTFRVKTTERGTIDSITEIGGRTSSGSRDYVTVKFDGTLDDGRAVEALVYCELQNKF